MPMMPFRVLLSFRFLSRGSKGKEMSDSEYRYFMIVFRFFHSDKQLSSNILYIDRLSIYSAFIVHVKQLGWHLIDFLLGHTGHFVRERPHQVAQI